MALKPEVKEAPKTRKVVITTASVWLPDNLNDPDPNAHTRRYMKREKLDLPAELADMLVKRDMAESLD